MTRTESYVREHIHRVQLILYKLINILEKRAEDHDKSKLLEPEKSGFEQMDQEPHYEYNSLEYWDKINRYKPILDHHYKYNRHHPEHWKGYMAEMDLLDLIEWLCDNLSYKEDIELKDAVKTLNTQAERFNIPDLLYTILINTAQRYIVIDGDPSIDDGDTRINSIKLDNLKNLSNIFNPNSINDNRFILQKETKPVSQKEFLKRLQEWKNDLENENMF